MKNNYYFVLQPEWKIVDPICTFLFSILVLVTTFNILRDTMIVLMEGMPKGVNFVDVLETFMSIDGVVRVHNLRVWALSPDKIALAAHLAVSKYWFIVFYFILGNNDIYMYININYIFRIDRGWLWHGNFPKNSKNKFWKLPVTLKTGKIIHNLLFELSETYIRF